MIRVTIDLINTVDNSRSHCKGICYITNNFVTTLKSAGKFGTYNYRITKWDPNINRVWKQGTVGPFDREKRGPWDLLYLVLNSVLGYRLFSDLPSGWIEDYITSRHSLKKGHSIVANKTKLLELYSDFFESLQCFYKNRKL